MWVVAAAHKKSTGPIDSYDSLNDEHLRAHYHKRLVRQRLASVGLVQCLKHRDKPNGSRCCTGANSAAGSSGDNASTTSSGDSGVCLQKDAAVSCCTACGRVALPAALREPVSPYLLPVDPSRKQLQMPRPNLQAASSTAGSRGLRRTSIMPASSSSGREDAPTKNHFPKKSDCKVSLVFHGSGRRAVSAEADQPVRVTQQHCGGTSLTVYDSRVARGGTFTFASRRHYGYPFSIVIFVNDIRDVQLSSCCEYRYKVGVRLGGPQGHFSLLRLEGGGPCYRCVLEERLKSLPLERRSVDSLLGDSSGLSSPVTTSSEAANQQSTGDGTSSASSTADRDNIEHSTTASESEESDGETEQQIVDAAGNGPSSNGTSYSTEASSSPSRPLTSGSEAVQEQIEGGSESSHLSAETVASELENAPASNSFEVSSNGGERLSEKSVYSETGSDASDKNQHKAHRSALHSSAYFVQDKKKQWGSDELRGESFSSDDDAQTITVTVHADVHSTP